MVLKFNISFRSDRIKAVETSRNAAGLAEVVIHSLACGTAISSHCSDTDQLPDG